MFGRNNQDQKQPAASPPAQARPEPVVREPVREEPQPAAVQQPEPEPEQNKAPETRVEPPPAKPAPKPAASTTGMWAVQLCSFSNKDNAEKLAADLRKQGDAAFLSQLSTDSGQLKRVRIGPQKDRYSGVAMASRLAMVGHH